MHIVTYRHDESLPYENIALIHMNVPKRSNARFLDVLQFLKQS